jgi:hypothetical protein
MIAHFPWVCTPAPSLPLAETLTPYFVRMVRPRMAKRLKPQQEREGSGRNDLWGRANLETGTVRNICILENYPARSRDSWDTRGKPTYVFLGKADDTVEGTGESTRWDRRGRGSSIQGKTFRANVGKLPWAAGTAYNLQRLFERG